MKRPPMLAALATRPSGAVNGFGRPGATDADTLVSPRRRTLFQALGAAALVAGCGDLRGTSARAALEFRGPTMGTTYTVKIAGGKLSAAGEAAARALAHDALEAIDQAMSAYRPDSELSRFNAHAADSPFMLSDDTFAVLSLAQRVSAETSGAFDVTVGPVVDAWGFGPGRAQRIVGDDEVRALEQRVGFRMLALDLPERAVVKARPDVRADLSGIAKGYGVDKAAEALDGLGIEHYMVAASGEIRTCGLNAEGRPWQIAIERPDAVPQRAHLIVPMSGRSISTSGDYRIFFERDGVRYCHEIDPATGTPIRNGLASVSVVAGDCAYADAMATALMVKGAERGLALADERDIAACFLVREPGGRFGVRQSRAFTALGATLVA